MWARSVIVSDQVHEEGVENGGSGSWEGRVGGHDANRCFQTARVQGFPKKEIRRFFADTTVRNEFAPDPSCRSREAVVGCASVGE